MPEKFKRPVLAEDLQVIRECVVENLTVLGTQTGGGGGDVNSVFGRTGIVVAANGDYNAGQVTLTPTGFVTSTTVQAGIAEIITKLAAVANGQGASLIGVEDAGASYSGTNVEAVLAEVATALGLRVLASVLASTSNGQGASLVGVEDSGGIITATNVEAALAEVAGVTSQVNAGSNLLVSPGSGVSISNELVPFRRFRLDLVNVDVSILAANDYGSFQLCTLPAGLLLFLCTRVNLDVSDQGNLGTLDDVDTALGTVAVAANDMSTGGCQSLMGTVNADSGGNIIEIQPQGATNSSGFSNPVYLNVTQMVGSNATARYNGSIEFLCVDLRSTGDA